MTKHRSVVTGWDPAHVNPDSSTGRPKGVQTASDMRIMTTYDVLAEGIFAAKGIPAITGSPTNTASISPFMAAIASPLGGFYVVSIDAAENFTINMANVGAVKVYVQQEDYQVDNTKVDSNVVIGVVYGANPIPANSILLFTTTITAQTSTNGLTFTPAFKYTGALSGHVRVPTQADLANIAVVITGMRALVTTTGGGGIVGEYFYTGSAWEVVSLANPKLTAFLAANVNADGSYVNGTIGNDKWRNNVAFRAYTTTAQNLVAGTFTKSPLPLEEYDLGNNHNTSTGVFTAPVTGVYQMHVSNSSPNNSARIFASLYVNGVEQHRTTNQTASSSNRSEGGRPIKLNAGDQVELYVWRAENGLTDASQTFANSLGGHLITRI